MSEAVDTSNAVALAGELLNFVLYIPLLFYFLILKFVTPLCM